MPAPSAPALLRPAPNDILPFLCNSGPEQIRALTGKTLEEIVGDWVADMENAAMDSLVVYPVSLDPGD